MAGYLSTPARRTVGGVTVAGTRLGTCSAELNAKLHIAATLYHLGMVAAGQNNYAEARSLYDQSLAAYQALDNRVEMGNVLRHLGLVAKDRGDFVQAIAYFNASLEAAACGGQPTGQRSRSARTGRGCLLAG